MGVEESIVYNIPHVPPKLLFAWIVWAIIITLSIIVARKATAVPSRLQVMFEMAIGYVTNLADELIGPEAYKFYPLFTGLFIFILIGNLIGLIPGLISPTSDANLTFGLALVVFLYFVFLGFKYNGIKYLRQFTGPKLPWYLFIITIFITITEVISFFIRPVSLGLRLFCNIFSKELFLEVLAILMLNFILSKSISDNVFTIAPLVLRPFILLLGLIVSFIQALIFMVLSMSYVAGAIHMEEH
jgi:F-type H+-transporting ATPase subunit a